jgi:hypothetical protein
MVSSLIICSLILMKVSEAGQVCFDDIPGTIDVSINIPIKFRRWDLVWDPWPRLSYQRSTSSQVVGASGCSDGGRFLVAKKIRGKGFVCPFLFTTDAHITCSPGRPFCSFTSTFSQDREIWWVRGELYCHCVPGDVLFDDSDANITYSAQIESIIVVQNEHISM